jgi:hypothetical protein
VGKRLLDNKETLCHSIYAMRHRGIIRECRACGAWTASGEFTAKGLHCPHCTGRRTLQDARSTLGRPTAKWTLPTRSQRVQFERSGALAVNLGPPSLGIVHEAQIASGLSTL